MQNRVYFDHAATSPILPEVVKEMCEHLQNNYGNPSSAHATGRAAKSAMENCRLRIAKLLHCLPSEIIFTAGGTEADNLILRGIIENNPVSAIITSAIEHHAVETTLENIAKSAGINRLLVNLLPNGHVDTAHLQTLLIENPGALVSLMHANNEIGNLLDLESIGELIHQFGGIFHSDTVQSMGNYAFDLSKGNVDFIAAAAHKFNGPKGIGFAYVSKKYKIHSQITGGAQERGLRAGTENVASIAGMTKALEIAYQTMEEKKLHCLKLKNQLASELSATFEDIRFNGDTLGNSLCNVLSVSFPNFLGDDMLLFNLDLEGFAVSGGSACNSGAVGGSHVIRAIGDITRTTIRFSFGKTNTAEEVNEVVQTLKKWVPTKQTLAVEA